MHIIHYVLSYGRTNSNTVKSSLLSYKIRMFNLSGLDFLTDRHPLVRFLFVSHMDLTSENMKGLGLGPSILIFLVSRAPRILSPFILEEPAIKKLLLVRLLFRQPREVMWSHLVGKHWVGVQIRLDWNKTPFA